MINGRYSKMWAEAMAIGTRGWDWHQRTVTYDPAGSTKTGRVVYENLKMHVFKEDKMRVSRKNGTIVDQYMYAILPVFQLRDVELEEDIEPVINRTFFVKGDDSFKVIGILDFSDDPEYFSYYLTLRRESLI